MNTRLLPSFIIAAGITLLLVTASRAEEVINTIKFSEPAKPATIKIRIGHGDLRINGVKSDTGEITVKSEAQAVTAAPRKDGLRVITASSSFALSEKANVVTLDATENWGGHGGSDFVVNVPANTAVVVSSAWGGDIVCSDLSGDIEIKGVSGEVKLNNISGGALVETMNGEITARILELREGKPLSFTSMNGEVALHLPAEAKANIRLRTQNGTILTDFDEKALITKTEAAAYTPKAGRRTVTTSRKNSNSNTNGDVSTNDEIRTAIREAVQVGAEAAREAAAAMREAAQAAREGAQAAREAGVDGAAPVAPMPPMPPLPPMTGGKIVSGTLNGGGPDIRIATMNGDVTLRKIDSKK
jgi:DUF4097 and DUF4098 domain-containing protein YvlB